MRSLLWWVLLSLLVVWIWNIAGQADEYYTHITYVPIQDPLSSSLPFKIPMYKPEGGREAPPAVVRHDNGLPGYSVEENTIGCTYTWDIDSPWPLDALKDFYADQSGSDPHPLPRNEGYNFRWQPRGAQEGEYLDVSVAPGNGTMARRNNVSLAPGSTYLHVIIQKAETGKLPRELRQVLELIGLYMLLPGLYFLYIDRVFMFFSFLWRWQMLHSNTQLYHRVGSGLSGLLYDPIRQSHWDACEKALEPNGFVKVCDCVHSLPTPRQYGRVLHKNGQIYCLAMFANTGRKRLVWLEFFSLFADGSAVYTTTHRDPEFKRPKEYPLFQVPESADTKAVLNVHLQNVEGHGGQLALVGPDKILEVLSALERTVLIHAPAPPPKATLATSSKVPPPPADAPAGGATSIPLAAYDALPVGPHAPLPVGPHAAKLKAPPPLVNPPPPQQPKETDKPEVPAVNEVTKTMAKYAADRDASVLGIAAVAATEKAEEHEALMAEKKAQEEFKKDVVSRIKELVDNDEMVIKEIDVLSLIIVIERGENELDLETPYYMSKSNPDSRAKIINGVAQRVKQGAF